MWPFQRNRDDYDGFDPDQARGHIQHFARHAPADVQESVYHKHFTQMPYEQREAIASQVPRKYGMDPRDPASMAHSFTRLSQERPDLLERIFSHPLLLGASVALAAMIGKHVHEHRERRSEAWQRRDEGQGSWWAGGPW
jgi:hypothetical protein